MTIRNIFLATAFIVTTLGVLSFNRSKIDQDRFVSYRVDLEKHDFKLYWKDDQSKPFRTLLNLKNWLDKKGQTLIFAMNAGMFKADNSPQGLFIQENVIKTQLDTTSGSGNFYLKPNGVFYTMTDNKAQICKTQDFVFSKK